MRQETPCSHDERAWPVRGTDARALPTDPRSRPTSSSSAPARPVRPPRPTWLAMVCTSRCWRRASSRGRRSAATASPRGRTRQLIRLGIDTCEQAGWLHNKGLRIYGGERPFQLDWPDLADFPPLRPGPPARRLRRAAGPQRGGGGRHAVRAQQCDRADHRRRAPSRSPACRPRTAADSRAPMVVAADGNSTRLSLAMGLNRREDRPMGVAVRTYYPSPRHRDDYLESWLELWDGKPGKSALLPGYGWIFGMGDGTCNVGLGHPEHLIGLREDRLQGPAQALAGQHTGGLGFPRREHDHPGARRGAADGLQPPAALRPRAAAGR